MKQEERNKLINIVIPMAGLGSRFSMSGFNLPKPFIDINGKMMIERVLDGLSIPNAHYTLVVQKEFYLSYNKLLSDISEKYRVAFIEVDELTQGACCTALAAREIIDNDIMAIFADSDNIFNNFTFRKFTVEIIRNNFDGVLLTAESQKNCYSYARTDNTGIVIETREKEVISNHAITGVYMFRHGCDFCRCAIDMLIYGKKTKNEYYMSNVYNRAIHFGMKIGVYDIPMEDWQCVGDPEQLREYLERNKMQSEDK